MSAKPAQTRKVDTVAIGNLVGKECERRKPNETYSGRITEASFHEGNIAVLHIETNEGYSPRTCRINLGVTCEQMDDSVHIPLGDRGLLFVYKATITPRAVAS